MRSIFGEPLQILERLHELQWCTHITLAGTEIRIYLFKIIKIDKLLVHFCGPNFWLALRHMPCLPNG